MTNEERINFLKMIFTLIFTSKEMNTEITQVSFTTPSGTWPGRWFVNNTLRGFDFNLNLGDRIISLRCVEQNPNKTDNLGNLKKYANLARQGHKIMWVIDTKNNQFLGRVHNDVWHASFIPATQPTQEVEATAYGHIENDIDDPNFHGIPGTSGSPMENLPIERGMQQNLPGAQNAAASLPEPMDINNLPEIPNGVDIPDYVFDQIADMDEPPAWDEYE